MRSLSLILFLLGGAILAAHGKTLALSGEQASVDVPETWTQQQTQNDSTPSTSTLILSAVSAEKNSLLQIQVCPNPGGMLAAQSALVANTRDAISNQIISHGGQVQFTSEGATQLNSVPAYLIQYTETTSAAKQIQSRLYQVAANGKLYLITLRTFDSSADSDLQGIANSFRFDAPPVLPVPRPPVHRLRYILLAGVGVLVLIGLGIGYYSYRQRQLYE